MKKIIFAMPLMAISLLASCGGSTSKSYFTVKFFDANDKVIQTIENVASGSKVEFTGDVPTKDSGEPSKKYKFRNWDRDINQPITSYTEFRPLYDDVNLFKVTFLDYDGTILKGGDAIPYYVEENTKPEAPNDPSREKFEGITYKFAGWDPEVKEISGPTTYTAKYTESYETYKVIFSIPDGSILYENNVQTVTYNGLATKPKVNPYRPGYNFEGWFSNSELTIPVDFGTKRIKGTTTIYSKWEEDPKFAVPLCITSNVDNNAISEKSGYYYKTNLNDDWVEGIDGNTISLDEGQSVYIGSDGAYEGRIDLPFPNNLFGASGNIMSLVNHNNFKFLNEVKSTQFGGLFSVSKIKDAENLLLPAIKLNSNCYSNMFQMASSLVTAPKLPAKDLANFCYKKMFAHCSNLKRVMVGFGDGTNWPTEEGCTQEWLTDVLATGTFAWCGSPDGPSEGRSENTVPEGWTIETY